MLPETTDVHIRLGKNGRLPLYATPGSAGCDLFAAAPLVLLPGQTRVLDLDLVIALEPGVEAQIRPRSGLSLRTALRLPNSPGTVDSDYRDPVGVLLHNTFRQTDLWDKLISDPSLFNDLEQNYRQTTMAAWTAAGATPTADNSSRQVRLPAFLADLPLFLDDQGNPYGTIYIEPGERVAQMVFSRHLQARFIEYERPEEIGRNRGGGFGSTGGHADLRS